MEIHEYQAKEILKGYGVPVPKRRRDPYLFSKASNFESGWGQGNELWDNVYPNLKSANSAIFSFPYSVIAHPYNALPYFLGFEYPGVQSGRTNKLPTFLLDLSSLMDQFEEVTIKLIEVPGIPRSPGPLKLNLNLVSGS